MCLVCCFTQKQFPDGIRRDQDPLPFDPSPMQSSLQPGTLGFWGGGGAAALHILPSACLSTAAAFSFPLAITKLQQANNSLEAFCKMASNVCAICLADFCNGSPLVALSCGTSWSRLFGARPGETRPRLLTDAGHVFHQGCILPWFPCEEATTNRCPTCRCCSPCTFGTNGLLRLYLSELVHGDDPGPALAAHRDPALRIKPMNEDDSQEDPGSALAAQEQIPAHHYSPFEFEVMTEYDSQEDEEDDKEEDEWEDEEEDMDEYPLSSSMRAAPLRRHHPFAWLRGAAGGGRNKYGNNNPHSPASASAFASASFMVRMREIMLSSDEENEGDEDNDGVPVGAYTW